MNLAVRDDNEVIINLTEEKVLWYNENSPLYTNTTSYPKEQVQPSHNGIRTQGKINIEKLLETGLGKSLAKNLSLSYNEADPLHKYNPCYQGSSSRSDYMAGSRGLGRPCYN
ncbi:hypothetical protein CROQUDRAFT_474312 [Cronartium quercuum f. sp. fusiforme G11]|uniref:Uncharacterized protein n=1 Tax=Cronartium quercuum f. sp. fusiforme G11 TaxID=708437 RepID=A0A9P6N7T4_9BASI|nr:hypothetical protein CROQUDRAFT_474312 [Cronartium quercuum f. sp. fusiforme G11]